MALGAIIGGALGFLGSRSAGKAQEGAAAASTALQREIYDENTARLDPFFSAGSNALAAYLYELGFGPAPTVGGTRPNYTIEEIPGVPGVLPPQFERMSDVPDHMRAQIANPSPSGFRVGGQTFDTRDAAQAWIDSQPLQGGTPYGGITMSPSAQFALESGRDTIEAGAASRGGLFSGATAKGLEEFRTGLATQDRDNQLNRLLGLVQGGQSAAAGQGAQGIQFAQNAGNNILQAGNARAAGIVGGVNSINDAIGNYYGYQTTNRLLDMQRAA